ncbi:DUF2306 domain-containing protein [Streptomyces boluensis]|uniref:DUF2306 domain-containing protein n=1 Tax=Streptomyces boluensis TaxID=1775135 RepID=UPI0028B020BA|nr:DUF2306 domain-containing protein [Streptomyces boluensis]
MAQHLKVAEPETPPAAAGPPAPARAAASAGSPARAWWRRPWVVPLAVVVLGFLSYVLPPYLGLDPKASLIPIRADAPAHYPMLVAHIGTGSIALLTVCLQLWPWLRRQRPAVHRWSGRVYVFVGVLPSAVLSFLITPLSPAPSIGTTLGGILWVITTGMGFWRAVQGRYLAHRRWMLYSFAFAINIVWGRVFFYVLELLGVTNQTIISQVVGTAPWLGWVINLFLVQWWLNRTADRKLKDLV